MPIVISDEAIKFAERINKTTFSDLYDINCGLHTGIPRCCILFYVTVWLFQERTYYAHYFAIQDKLLGKKKAHYVCCPKCIIQKTTIEIKSCQCRRYKKIIAGNRIGKITSALGVQECTLSV